MGGKTATSTQSVAIPKEVLARYNAVNTRAENVASRPFQQYGTTAEAFVAPINQQQMAGIGNINQSAGLAQPYYGMAGNMTLAGAGAVNPQQYSAGAVQQYMSPYVSNVADTTAAQMKNLFGQQAEELKGGAIRSGAFGGDRAGIAQGNLANQQGLSFGQNMANIYGQGFNQAQQQFNQQQAVNLQAGQANQARLLGAAQQYGGLGGAAQSAALQGAQAQLGAGTLQQQTEQAGLTALYNQFQQQQAYPFQVAQFLANIAMGTGALSGSTTTTTQPAPFFSDERMKDNIETIGKTFDGQNIVKFNYKGDKQKQIGLVAQDVEKHHPEAVGSANGMKTVDYDGATQEAARRGKAMGGLSSEGGAVMPQHAGLGFAAGGEVDLDNLLARHASIYSGFKHPGMPREGGFSGLPHGARANVPEANLPVRELMRAGPLPEQQASALEQGMTAVERAQKIAGMFDTSDPTSLSGLAKRAAGSTLNDDGKTFDEDNDPSTPKAYGGGLSYASGGTLPYGEENYSDAKLDIPNDKSSLRLPTSGMPQQQGSGLGDLATMVSLGKTILTGIPFFASGGRAGYEDGGTIEAIKRSLAKIESGGEKDPYLAIGPETKKGNRAYGKYQVMDFNIPTWTQEALGKPMSPQEFLKDAKAQEAVASHKLGQYYKQHGNPDDVASIWFTGKPVAKAGLVSDATPTTKGITNVEYLNRFRAGLGDIQGSAAEAPKTAGLAPTDERANVPAPNAVTAGPPEEKKKSSGLGMNQETIVPLLTGLGAMLSSRSPYLASAIGEGLVAGGQSYMGTQKQAADIARTGAETELTMAGIPRIQEAQGIAFFLVRQPDGNYGWVPKSEYSPSMGAPIDPNSVPKSDLPPLPSGAGAGLSGGATPPAATGLSPDGTPTEPKPVNVTDLDPNSMNALNVELETLKRTGPGPRKDLINPAIAEGNSATKLVTDLNQYAMNLSMLPKDSLIAGSVASPYILEAKKTAKQLIDQFKLQGLIPDVLEPDLTGANWAEEINKVKAAITAGRTGEAGQRAVAALDKFAEMLPDTTTSFDGRRDNTAAVMVRNQQDIERGQFAQNWFNEAARRGGDAQANLTGNSMNEAFQNKTEAQYRQDKETLKKLFETRIDAPGTANNGMTYLAYLAKKDKPITPKERDFIIQKFGNPAIFRYFPNLGVK